MKLNSFASGVFGIAAWLTGIIVSIVISLAMIQGILFLPSWLGGGTAFGIFIVKFFGWLALATTVIGVIVNVFKKN